MSLTQSRATLPAGALSIAGAGTAAVALAAWFGVPAIGGEVLAASWVVPLCVALHAVQLWLSALAWRAVANLSVPSVWRWLRIRWIRESVNALLPVAQLGGNLVGIRLLTQRGAPLARASAGTVLDLTVEALTQLLFTLVGIGVLATMDGGHSWRPWLGAGLAAMAVGVGGFLLAQRAGLLRLIEALAARISQHLPGLPPDALRGLDAELSRLQRRGLAMARAASLHLLAWVLGVAETWMALAAMGRARDAATCLVIESLAMAARSAGFAVPGALGVQEGGFLLACGLFGVPPDAAIAVSVLKRLRELTVSVPGVLDWQWSEAARLARRVEPTV